MRKKKPLHVTLNVRESSTIHLTVAEKVQLDRLVSTPAGHVAERCGGLLRPGSIALALAPGRYFFKTLSDAHLKVVCGGVDAILASRDKDVPPEPKAVPTKGDDPPGDAPALTIDD